MQEFILNIGLNVGYIEPKTQLDRVNYHLNNVLIGTLKTTLKDSNNGGVWLKERVLIVEGKTELSVDEFSIVIKNLCFLLSQEAIAFCLLGSVCSLVYSEDFNKERFVFDEAYFLRK